MIRLTGEITWEVNGSASCKNKTMENWAHGRGVFLFALETPFPLALPLMLGVWLPRFTGSARFATSESDSEIPSATEIPLPYNKGVCSPGTVGIATAMIFCLAEGATTKKERWERNEGEVRSGCTAFGVLDGGD